MELSVPNGRNRRHQLAAMATTAGMALARSAGTAAANRAIAGLASLGNTMSPGRPGGRTTASAGNQAMPRRGRNPPRRRSGGRQGSSLPGIPRTLPGAQPIRLRVTGVWPQICTTAGVCNFALALGVQSGLSSTAAAPSATIFQYLPNAAAIATAYRLFRIRGVRFSFRPEAGYTATGYYAMGVDPLPIAGTPSSEINVLRNIPSISGDVKDTFDLFWAPTESRAAQWKYGNSFQGGAGVFVPPTGVVVPEFDLSHGLLQVYSSTGFTAATEIGQVFIEADIEFSEPA